MTQHRINEIRPSLESGCALDNPWIAARAMKRVTYAFVDFLIRLG